jgi:hypothetical protein
MTENQPQENEVKKTQEEENGPETPKPYLPRLVLRA